jgi:hypothetical protein
MVVSSCCVSPRTDYSAATQPSEILIGNAGRVPITRRADGAVVGLVARRDLLRIRATTVRHERDREALIRIGKRRISAAGFERFAP